MANINKIRLSGTTYNIQDPNAQPLLTAGQGITIENNVISATGGGSVSSAITSGDTNAVAGGAVYDKFDEVEQVTAAGLNALNDKINPTVELTQAQYEALVSGGTVDSNTYYIITDAQPVDISNYWTSAQTNSAINAAVANKVDKSAVTSSVTSASTNTEIPTAKAVYDAIPTGGTGGGKAIEAGTNISVTTGETADTVSCTLPISTDGNYSGKGIILGNGNGMSAKGACSIVGGSWASASTNAHNSFAVGSWINASNEEEFVCGGYNITRRASATFGDSGNTLFSVGNGTADNARHNAFEIRQNGDIYITSGGTDIKLQDNLGGGEASSAITSGDTNAVAGGAVYDKFDEVEQVTAAGLNAVNGKFGGLKLEQISQSAYNALVTKDASTLYIIVN